MEVDDYALGMIGGILNGLVCSASMLGRGIVEIQHGDSFVSLLLLCVLVRFIWGIEISMKHK